MEGLQPPYEREASGGERVEKEKLPEEKELRQKDEDAAETRGGKLE